MAARRAPGPRPHVTARRVARTFVPIILVANSFTILTARGARFLKPTPCSFLCRWIVYSRATTSCVRWIFSPFAFAILAAWIVGSKSRT